MDLLQNKTLKLSLGMLFLSKIPLHPLILSFKLFINLAHHQPRIRIQLHHIFT